MDALRVRVRSVVIVLPMWRGGVFYDVAGRTPPHKR